ncbi:MAG: aminodeoxychorismate synthase component I [Acidobacteria bacterium]|nr:aminodeoxychorismate synthase component I [Acidobacteriota bacterium]
MHLMNAITCLDQHTYVPLPAAWRAKAAAEVGSVLLETCRFDEENYQSYLFRRPVEVLTVSTLDGVPHFFQRIEQALLSGRHVAGFFSYELGFAFEPRLRTGAQFLPQPLAWIGIYEAPLVFDHRNTEKFGAQPSVSPHAAHCELNNVCLGMDERDYRQRVEQIRKYIADGQTYQVNFTDQLLFDFSGTPLALYETLLRNQKVAYAAYLNLGHATILSFSPELFFRLDGGRIVTRPMKGTLSRGRFSAEDARQCSRLGSSEKDRAENVMIVDLLRNDLGRVCELGSVQVESLFAVERYETLFQMTSTVVGTIRSKASWSELFAAIFPSGSVTGAPKLRTMQIIHELEREPRGVYTGAIGFMAPSGKAAFNVAIRTIVLRGTRGEMGVGSGITFASDPASEYEECRLKARFLLEPAAEFQLIESIRWDGEYRLLDLHLERLRASAEYFGFLFDTALVRAALREDASRLDSSKVFKVRLLLRDSGGISIDNAVPAPVRGMVAIAPVRVNSADRFLFHKTTRRELYDRWLAEARQRGLDDYIFLNERGEVTEGAGHNIFVAMGDRLYTPPVECGLLPGIFRRQILESNPRAAEKVLRIDDLHHADQIFVCNAIRGLQPVKLDFTLGDGEPSPRTFENLSPSPFR